ncbi:MFS transporter [Armillaria gallica]|uniref:MFS transporter n=1 Tax=Armillaria gallica TaxID=47427 RepID=A0A2H3CPX8_ARMGA|nr:MFS transporter [Armillaria gallica]
MTPPACAPHSFATPAMAASKEGGEAEIVIDDDDDVIDILAEKRLLRQLDLRILPAVALMFILGGLAGNLGNAIILNADTGDSFLQVLHLSTHQFYAVAAASSLTTTLFQVPSIYMLKYFSPSYWLAFLMLGWGATLMVMAASKNYITTLLLRLLLGAFEAGVAPGVVYFSAFWYRCQERSLRIAFVYASGTLGGAFGVSIAYGVASLNGARGLEGWRWLFLIEGVPSCLLAILVYLFLPSFPETSSWLSPNDRALAIRRMKQESSKSLAHDKITWGGAKSTLKDGRLYLHYLLTMVSCIPPISLALFAPTIINELGYQGRNAQLFAVPPFAASFAATLGLSVVADKYRVWSMCCLVSYVIAGATFIVQGTLPPTAFKARYVLLCFGAMFSLIPVGPIPAWFTGNLRETNATTLAIAISSTFTIGGSVIAVFLYKLSDAPGYRTGHYTNGGILFFCAACIQMLRMIYKRRNRELQIGQDSWIV